MSYAELGNVFIVENYKYKDDVIANDAELKKSYTYYEKQGSPQAPEGGA